ncbi:hypothetical protein CHS0354_041867 [Potamilus streckersoni]|uniref:NadR/Ttd14 AAA domain-containing protein n=1 Tax=Potamilus streckersoni TaxID=2493646 RepID=A0AAE0ST55_9BIVA|nr:hypothetical protein CHS0354_041867 [Potamilus streckersoni]
MTHIYICGAHSTGKTTLMHDLKPHLRVKSIEEVAREIIREHGWSRNDFAPNINPHNFEILNAEILQKQILLSEEYDTLHMDAIFERCLDALIYVELYIGHVIKSKLYNTPGLHKWILRPITEYRNDCSYYMNFRSHLLMHIKHRIKYEHQDGIWEKVWGFRTNHPKLKNKYSNGMRQALVFLVFPHPECAVDDGVRVPPDSEEQARFTQLLEDELRTNFIPYHKITMLDRMQRVDFVLDKVRQIKQDLVIDA